MVAFSARLALYNQGSITGQCTPLGKSGRATPPRTLRPTRR